MCLALLCGAHERLSNESDCWVLNLALEVRLAVKMKGTLEEIMFSA